jgi:hypothetical protein
MASASVSIYDSIEFGKLQTTVLLLSRLCVHCVPSSSSEVARHQVSSKLLLLRAYVPARVRGQTGA